MKLSSKLALGFGAAVAMSILVTNIVSGQLVFPDGTVQTTASGGAGSANASLSSAEVYVERGTLDANATADIFSATGPGLFLSARLIVADSNIYGYTDHLIIRMDDVVVLDARYDDLTYNPTTNGYETPAQIVGLRAYATDNGNVAEINFGTPVRFVDSLVITHENHNFGDTSSTSYRCVVLLGH